MNIFAMLVLFLRFINSVQQAVFVGGLSKTANMKNIPVPTKPVQYLLKPFERATDLFLTTSSTNSVDCMNSCSSNNGCCGFAFSLGKPFSCFHFDNCAIYNNDKSYIIPFYVKSDYFNQNIQNSDTSTRDIGDRTLETSTSDFSTSAKTDSITTATKTDAAGPTSTAPAPKICPTNPAFPMYDCSDMGSTCVEYDELFSKPPCSHVDPRNQLPLGAKYREMPKPGNAEWFTNMTIEYSNNSTLGNLSLTLDSLYEEETGTYQVLTNSKLLSTECSLLFICKNACKALQITTSNKSHLDTGRYGLFLTWTGNKWSMSRDRRNMVDQYIVNANTNFEKIECVKNP